MKKQTERRKPREVEYITQEKGIFISVAPWKGQLCFPPPFLWNFTRSGRASRVFLEVVGGRRIKERQISPEQLFFSLKKLTSKHQIVSLPSEWKIYYRSWARSLADRSLFNSTDFSNRRGELSRRQDNTFLNNIAFGFDSFLKDTLCINNWVRIFNRKSQNN